MKRAALLWLILVHSVLFAEPAKPWQRLENCRLIPDRWNDGDRFHVQLGKEAYLFRLYFVDTPEAEADYVDSVKERADYFGVTPADAVKLGKQTSGSAKPLAGVLTVHTRWNKAPGRS